VNWLRLVVTSFALLLGTVACCGVADEPKKDDKQVVESKAVKRQPATAVNFSKELGLGFPSLKTLGARIEAARRAHDPVSLGHAAQELAVAEKVAGKKATLTSTALVKEAAQLAQVRRQEKELQAMVNITNQVASEEDLLGNLNQQLQLAREQIKAEKAAIQSNEEPTGPRRLVINNYTTQYMDIWVNGFLKMQVEPGGSKWCMIEHKWNPTVITAYGDDDSQTWGPRTIWGTFKTYTWNLQ
jgi:hypothetical protein